MNRPSREFFFDQSEGMAEFKAACPVHYYENREPELHTKIKDFIASKLERETFSYPHKQSQRLYSALSDYHQMAEEWFHVGLGVDGLLKEIFQVFTQPKDLVLALNPTWRTFVFHADFFGCKLQLIDYDDDPYGQESVAKLCKTILTLRPKLIYLISPDALRPRVFSNHQLKEILLACQQSSSLLLVDEAYADFRMTQERATELLSKEMPLVILRSFSKSFGIAGLRVGYAISRPEWILRLSKGRHIAPTSGLSMSVASYLLNHSEFVMETVNKIKVTRDYMQKSFVDLGFDARISQANVVPVCFADKEAQMLAILKKHVTYLDPQQSYLNSKYYFLGVPPLDVAQNMIKDCRGHI